VARLARSPDSFFVSPRFLISTSRAPFLFAQFRGAFLTFPPLLLPRLSAFQFELPPSRLLLARSKALDAFGGTTNSPADSHRRASLSVPSLYLLSAKRHSAPFLPTFPIPSLLLGSPGIPFSVEGIASVLAPPPAAQSQRSLASSPFAWPSTPDCCGFFCPRSLVRWSFI